MPKELKLNGNEETFTVEVKYNTYELYGKVEGRRRITIYADGTKELN